MKKILFLLPFIGSSLLQAQKFEVSAAYGTPSVYGVGNMFADALVNIGTNSEEISGSNGVLNINALVYNHNMKWRYGLEFNVEFLKRRARATLLHLLFLSFQELIISGLQRIKN